MSPPLRRCRLRHPDRCVTPRAFRCAGPSAGDGPAEPEPLVNGLEGYRLQMPQQMYWKVPFEWTASKPPVEDSLPDGWSWRDGVSLEEPVKLVADVLANSPGPEDALAVDRLGAEEAARRTVALAPGFSYLPGRWHVLMVRHAMAGFVLPVVYDGCARNGLDEATIYHMGVAAESRGLGIGRLLLRRATRVLVDHGVWRVYCDTPSNDHPMIHLFETEGWLRLPDHECPIGSPE